MKLINKLFPAEDQKAIKKLNKVVDAVFALEDTYKGYTLDELKNKSIALRDTVRAELESASQKANLDLKTSVLDPELRVKSKKLIKDILDQYRVEAFALVREAARRTLNMSHYRVQVIGGLMMHDGYIAEMRTGEGKTLVATGPAYLNALSGLGVHIVTVNDYLSKRDAVWMGQVYNLLGISTAVINHDKSYIYDESHTDVKDDSARDEVASYKVEDEFLRPVTRNDAYNADITYGTNNEFGFDYLKDNLVQSKSEMVQRGHYYAIVDEIDSILIDESRTPLIISSATHDSGNIYEGFAKLAESMTVDVDYTVDEKQKAVQVTDAGIKRAEAALKLTNLYTTENMRLVHHLETALRAKSLFIKEKQYVVKDGEVVIVDEFTGRMQPGRRWSDGLHQAVEAKEGVEVNKESRTIASITFQNYFRFYVKLSGMTGTGKTSEEEFYKVYQLPVATIPTHNAIRRKDNPDQIFQTEKGKWKAITKKVKELQEKGQPVLIGTVSIEHNEVLSRYFGHAKIDHKVLNAKNHEKEGEIIADAGKSGAVTIATNMAGRGVDIKLGGANASKEAYEEVKALGGLFVIGTERHEARRIDNQLRGRSGRQGDTGETQFYVSLEDDLMRIFGSDRIKTMMGKFGIPEDEPITSRIVSNALEGAQEKIEGFHFDARKQTLQYDDVLNQQRKAVYNMRAKILSGDEGVTDLILNRIKNNPETGEANIKLIEEKEKIAGTEFRPAVRAVLLQIYDIIWMDHLEQMEYLRSSVGLRAYGQRDPLVEYKKEGLHMYKELDHKVDSLLLNFITHIGE